MARLRRGARLMTLLGFAFLGFASETRAIVIEFSEVPGLVSGTPLDGSPFFDPFGISFADTTVYAEDPVFVGAGTDESGVASGGGDSLLSVLFTTPASELTLYWLTVAGSDVFGEAFDPGGVLVASFGATGLSGTTYGSETFSGVGPIAKITLHDGTGAIGLGKLEFTTAVPEPGTAVLAGLGLLGLVSLRRRLRR